jgi:hypothetical protein
MASRNRSRCGQILHPYARLCIRGALLGRKKTENTHSTLRKLEFRLSRGGNSTAVLSPSLISVSLAVQWVSLLAPQVGSSSNFRWITWSSKQIASYFVSETVASAETARLYATRFL